jgi:glycosyltransferase involved in cell wall biosynthesis
LSAKGKIAIFTGYFVPHMGGVERYSEKLATALHELGYEIVVVTSNDSGAPSHDKLHNYSVYRLPIRDLAKNRYPIPKRGEEYRALIKQVEAENIDYFILQTRFHLTSLVGARMGRRLGKPVVCIEHGTNHLSVGNPALDWFGAIYEDALTFYLKRFVDKFYGVSEACNVWLRHFGIKASGVFYNAVSAGDRRGVKDTYAKRYPKDEIVIAYAGRLIKEKGVMNLIEAFQAVDEKVGKLRLAIAGSGPLLEEIKKNPDPRIDLVGKLSFADVMSLYKRTDIFVHPSQYPEGLPTAVLEAGLMDCAVVATPRGGTAEVISDRGHGRIVDGSVGSLREAITWYVEHPKDRKSCAENLRHRIEAQFEWSVVAGQVAKELKGFSS